jgi:L-ascorbate metabolism protein UlaG (beta-lactamase superfamily)
MVKSMRIARGILQASMAFLLTCGTAGDIQRVSHLASRNFRNGEFHNREATVVIRDGSIWNSLKRWISSDVPREPVKGFVYAADSIPKIPSEGKLLVMWIGHSTVYIEIDGRRYCTDPMWNRRASPFRFAGPARFFPAPIPIDSLPELDGVIISHDHYDHLDEESIRAIDKKTRTFYVPLGVGGYLRDWGVDASKIHEMDWMESVDCGNGHRITASPSRHFSGRSAFRRNRTLWSSWIITGPKHRVFFGGDGGYHGNFGSIGRDFGPFDLVFLEIGAYDKNWPDIHMGPENAVRAMTDLGGGVLLPVHWGTFNLALHSWTEPVERVIACADDKGIPLCLPTPGRLINLSEMPVRSDWWVEQNAYGRK